MSEFFVRQELIPQLIKGAAREFRGDALEGMRADELNEATGYAFSAAPEDLDQVPTEDRRQMVHKEVVEWLSANDPKSRMTKVIYDLDDLKQEMQGYVYLNRTDADIQRRAERVKALVTRRGYAVTDETPVFEMNFDAPWHENDAYVSLVEGATRETLHELFENNPNACVMMYVAKEDYYPDGKVLKNLGATRVGQDTYLNNPQSRTERWQDHVYFMDRASFAAASKITARP